MRDTALHPDIDAQLEECGQILAGALLARVATDMGRAITEMRRAAAYMRLRQAIENGEIRFPKPDDDRSSQ